MISRRFLLLESGTFSISYGINWITSTSRIFSKTNLNCSWSNHWHHRNARSLLLTAPQTIILPLKLYNGWLPLSIEILNYATFAPIMQLKKKHILCWNTPYIAPINNEFPSLFEKVALRSLGSFFQLDHQIDIMLYLTEAITLCHSRELVGPTLSWCTVSPISLSTSKTLRKYSLQFHFI